MKQTLGWRLIRPVLMTVLQFSDVFFATIYGRLDRLTVFLLFVPVVAVVGVYFGIFTLIEAAVLGLGYVLSVAVRHWIAWKFRTKIKKS